MGKGLTPVQHIVHVNQMLHMGSALRSAHVRHPHVVMAMPILRACAGKKLWLISKPGSQAQSSPRKQLLSSQKVPDEDHDPISMESPKSQKPETSWGKSASGIQAEELPPSLKKYMIGKSKHILPSSQQPQRPELQAGQLAWHRSRDGSAGPGKHPHAVRGPWSSIPGS